MFMQDLSFPFFLILNSVVISLITFSISVSKSKGMLLYPYTKLMNKYDKYLIVNHLHKISGNCTYCTSFYVSVIYCTLLLKMNINDIDVIFAQSLTSIGSVFLFSLLLPESEEGEEEEEDEEEEEGGKDED